MERSSGLLMHPTSLPSRGGIGDFGPAAYSFLDWLLDAKQTLWQILPLGPVGYGNSPYSCTSAFAGNVLMISLERLAERGLIDSGRLKSLPDGNAPVDYESVRERKIPLLREAARAFLESAGKRGRGRYEQFCSSASWWLEEYVLFSALREYFGYRCWNEWPQNIARRDPQAIAELRSELHQEMEEERFLQFAFFEQWAALRTYADSRGIRVVGDVAIFVSYDSADVWTRPEIFRLREDLSPAVVAGVPPDVFSETGQRWGNPLYDWNALKSHGYDWWIDRMRWAIENHDFVRLDHFRGFEAYWQIPADEPTAVNGWWEPGPGDELFKALQNALDKLPFIAEDLGSITADVNDFRERVGIPGMKALQFGWDNRPSHIYLPHQYERNCVVYTGTHDLDTALGWWNSASETKKRLAALYLGIRESGPAVSWAFVRGAMTSVANLAIFPVQDILGLGSEARMNVPSRAQGNWSWRLAEGALTPELARKLATLTEMTDRDSCVKSPPAGGHQGDGQTSEEFAA